MLYHCWLGGRKGIRPVKNMREGPSASSPLLFGWLRGPAVESQSLAGVLSLSWARPVADG